MQSPSHSSNLPARKFWIDWIRVIAIILVITVHASSRYFKSSQLNWINFSAATFYTTIASPCVPLFIMISGYLLIPKKEPTKKVFNRVTRLLIPLLIWSIIYAFYPYQSSYFSSINQQVTTLQSLKLSLAAAQSPRAFHLWFLYMLTGLYLALPVLRQIGLSLTQNTFIWLTALTGVNYFLELLNPVLMPWIKVGIGWSVGLGFANIFFFYFIGGYCLGHEEWFKDRISILPKILLSLTLTTFILALVIKRTNIPFDIIACASPLMSILIFLIFKTIGQKKSIFSVDISTKVNFLANQTYSIYLMHLIILDWVMFALERIKAINIIGLWISIPLAVGSTYAISVFLITCLRGSVREGKWLTWLFP